jgi:hypothetical protein
MHLSDGTEVATERNGNLVQKTTDAPASFLTRVFRLICGDDWFDITAANDVLLDKIDQSRRTYRWFFDGLHRLDFPVLTRQPLLRTCLIVTLCGCGFIFSLTGVVFGCALVP